MNNDPLFEYIGNIHIHSSFSDGDATVSEIAQCAAGAGLDFIVLNDHDFLTDSLHLDLENFYDDVLVLLGLEIGKQSHHYLAYDLKEMVKANDLRPQGVIDRVNSQGGFGFLAHPFEKGMSFRQYSPAYTWKDLTVTGYSGICIWNFSSRWKERVKTLVHGLFFLLFKSRMLKGPSRTTLTFWDNACQTRKVVAVGGSDAHGLVFQYAGLRFRPLTYEYLLNSINIHILLDSRLIRDLAYAKAKVYEAMKQGRLFIAHDRVAPAAGFRFYYGTEDGVTMNMGEEKAFQPGELHICTPEHGEIRLIRDGSLIKKWQGEKAVYKVEQKGVYRVEVYRHMFLFGWRPWIYSNPIYLRE